MLKLLGALGVFSALSWLGIEKGSWYIRRHRCLQQWHQALLEGERLLCDLNCPTEEFLLWMSNCPGLGKMGRRCQELLGYEERLEPAWSQALVEASFPLQEDELRLLGELGHTLGRYDGEEQRRYIRVCLHRLEDCLLRAEEEKLRLSRMWSVIGLSCGAMAVVLLF